MTLWCFLVIDLWSKIIIISGDLSTIKLKNWWFHPLRSVAPVKENNHKKWKYKISWTDGKQTRRNLLLPKYRRLVWNRRSRKKWSNRTSTFMEQIFLNEERERERQKQNSGKWDDTSEKIKHRNTLGDKRARRRDTFNG